LAQWQEGLLDPEQKIARPRQVYTGPAERHLPGVEVASSTPQQRAL
jgi:citrate synthase